MNKNNKNHLHNPTLRVINILEAIDNSVDGINLSELSKKTNYPKSTISPILYTLLSKKYIAIDDASKYKIGPKSFLLGSSYFSSSNNIDVIKNEMEDIVDACNEICQLGILIDYDVFYLAKVDSKQPVKLVSSVGKKLPAYATALGKALLSGYSDARIKNHYQNGLKPITKNTITDINELLKQINEIRSGKLAHEFGEIDESIGCIATPLRKNEEVVAAISISFPLYRATKDKKNLIAKTLYEKRRIIEQLIGKLDIKF